MIPPGATIGILGGGQLGRMTGIAARQLGYGVAVLDPSPGCPAAAIADLEVNTAYDDRDGLDRLIARSDVITYEFENVPVAAAEHAASQRPTHPAPRVLHICQNRAREKQFLRDAGFPCAPFAIVSSADELAHAAARIGLPAVLKTADFGYDGKGQRKLLAGAREWQKIWDDFDAPRAMLEGFIDFEVELSVIIAANGRGDFAVYPVAENIHTNHILDFSIVPARVLPVVAREASDLACAIAESLGVVGLLAVEMFVTRDGRVLVNELAPRPHNSGHWSIDGAITSQFEQHVRAVCGLPLGDTRAHQPSVMVNLLGDLWTGGTPDWARLLKDPGAKLHLYGKPHARPGRKMGHATIVADEIESALQRARALKAALVVERVKSEE
ncbi:MAG: 5-(carboxyamino)imidazole ribonucleotide synthase [Opitutaceae bacterium]